MSEQSQLRVHKSLVCFSSCSSHLMNSSTASFFFGFATGYLIRQYVLSETGEVIEEKVEDEKVIEDNEMARDKVENELKHWINRQQLLQSSIEIHKLDKTIGNQLFLMFEDDESNEEIFKTVTRAKGYLKWMNLA